MFIEHISFISKDVLVVKGFSHMYRYNLVDNKLTGIIVNYQTIPLDDVLLKSITDITFWELVDVIEEIKPLLYNITHYIPLLKSVFSILEKNGVDIQNFNLSRYKNTMILKPSYLTKETLELALEINCISCEYR